MTRRIALIALALLMSSCARLEPDHLQHPQIDCPDPQQSEPKDGGVGGTGIEKNKTCAD